MRLENAMRTWQSVCGDCTKYQKRICRFATLEISPDDSIAAVCDGFQPRRDVDAEGRANARRMTR